MMRSKSQHSVIARLDRAIQYSLTPAMESRGRGVLSPRLRGDDKSGNDGQPPYFSPTLNGGSLPGGVVSSAIASIIATIT